MLVEVALEIEVGQLLTLRDAEELLERGIGLDVVLVLEALLLHVVVDGLGDLRAGHLGALGLAEEVAELIGNLGGALKDGGGALDLIAVLINLRLALALASILNLAVDALLQALNLAEESSDGLAHGGEVASHGLDVLIKRGRGGRNRGGLGGGRRDRATTTGAGAGAAASVLVALAAFLAGAAGAGAATTGAGVASTATSFFATFLATLGAVEAFIILVVGVFCMGFFRTNRYRGSCVCQFLEAAVDFCVQFLFFKFLRESVN